MHRRPAAGSVRTPQVGTARVGGSTVVIGWGLGVALLVLAATQPR